MDFETVLAEALELREKVGILKARGQLRARRYTEAWLDRWMPLPAAYWRAADFNLEDVEWNCTH